MDRILRIDVLTIRSARQGGKHVVALEGELDLAGYATASDELKRVEATDAKEIVIDLGGLTFIDSTGMRLLLEANARSRSDSGRLRILRASGQVESVLAKTGIDQRLPF